MSLYETLLFFHVLGAFALVAGTTAMAPFALGWGGAALEGVTGARLAVVGAALSGIGAVLTIVLGLWLVDKVGYAFFRFWIVGALVLWVGAAYCNGNVAGAARRLVKGEADRKRVALLWAGDMLGAVLILVLMVWKPGH